MSKDFKRGDYVWINYDNEDMTAKVLEIDGDKAKLQLCLSARRGEEILTDQVTVELSKLNKLSIKQ